MAKRGRALLESNSPRNNQPETHQDDKRGRGRRVAPSAFATHRIDRFPYASKNSSYCHRSGPSKASGAIEKIDCSSNTRELFCVLCLKIDFSSCLAHHAGLKQKLLPLELGRRQIAERGVQAFLVIDAVNELAKAPPRISKVEIFDQAGARLF